MTTIDSQMFEVQVQLKYLEHGRGLKLPEYQSDDAAGFDLLAAVPEATPVTIQPRESALVPTGFAMQLPPGYEAQVRPRSGLALKHGITVLNTPGTIDADYRGEVGVILINHGSEAFVVNRGDRIAQMVVKPVVQASLCVVDEIDETLRGEGGFGSTDEKSI